MKEKSGVVNICANCGREFLVYGGMWGYAYAGHRTCSYRCMRAMRAEEIALAEAKARRSLRMYKKLTEDDLRTVRELREAGKTVSEIAAELGCTAETVRTWIKKLYPEAAKDEPAAEKAVMQIERARVEMESGEKPDTVRIINALCDAIELLKRLYLEAAK